MQHKHIQTHIDTCYVCFLPSQISQLRPLLDYHKEIIEAQYPLRDKTSPYYISTEYNTFLFIPVGNLKNIETQKIIDLIIEIESLNFKISETINIPGHVDIHMALLEKYLSHEHMLMIQTAIYNLFNINNDKDNIDGRLKELPEKVVSRTLCLVNDENIKMYEYVPDRVSTLFIIIAHESSNASSLLNALLERSIGIIFIRYSETLQEQEERIAFNGMTVKTHSNNYYNILFDILFYAKQYRLSTACIHSIDQRERINCGNPTDKLNIRVKHNNVQFISKLIGENFEFTYHFQHQLEKIEALDLKMLEQLGINIISPNVLEVDLINYPDNQPLYAYLIKLMNEALDECK